MSEILIWLLTCGAVVGGSEILFKWIIPKLLHDVNRDEKEKRASGI